MNVLANGDNDNKQSSEDEISDGTSHGGPLEFLFNNLSERFSLMQFVYLNMIYA
jgi:hypothetical protein